MSESLNLPPFFVGQKVVALKTSHVHRGVQLVKNLVYTVHDVKKCSCGKWLVFLSELVYDENNTVSCHIPYNTRIACVLSDKVAPVQSQSEFISIEYSKVLEEEKKLTCAN